MSDKIETAKLKLLLECVKRYAKAEWYEKEGELYPLRQAKNLTNYYAKKTLDKFYKIGKDNEGNL